MALMRFDTFRDFDRLAEQMPGTTTRPRTMPLAPWRRKDEFFVHIDLPGVRRDDVELTVERNVVGDAGIQRGGRGSPTRPAAAGPPVIYAGGPL